MEELESWGEISSAALQRRGVPRSTEVLGQKQQPRQAPGRILAKPLFDSLKFSRERYEAAEASGHQVRLAPTLLSVFTICSVL
jgi:hypothetical protein